MLAGAPCGFAHRPQLLVVLFGGAAERFELFVDISIDIAPARIAAAVVGLAVADIVPSLLRAVGALLTFSMLVAPGASALCLTESLGLTFLLSLTSLRVALWLRYKPALSAANDDALPTVTALVPAA